MNRSQQDREFAKWASDYNGLFWKVARSFAPAGCEEDLYQELLLAAWQAAPLFRGESKPSTFLYRVSVNRALAWLASRQRSIGGETAWGESAVETAAAGPVTPDERVEALYREIRLLPLADRTLILLYLDGLSYKEAAEVMGLTETNTGVRINRLKKRLAERLREQTQHVERL